MKTFKQFVEENEVKIYEYKWKTKSSKTWNNLFSMKTLDKSFEDTIPSYLTELVKSNKVNPSTVEFAVFVSGGSSSSKPKTPQKLSGEKSKSIVAAGKKMNMSRYMNVDDEVAQKFGEHVHKHEFTIDPNFTELDARGQKSDLIDSFVKNGLISDGDDRYKHKLTDVGREISKEIYRFKRSHQVNGDKMVWSKDAYCDNVLFHKKQKIKTAYIVEVIAQHNIHIEDYELKANKSGKYIVQEIQNDILYAIPFDILDNMKDPDFDNIVWDEIDEKYRERVKIDLNSVLVKILHKTK